MDTRQVTLEHASKLVNQGLHAEAKQLLCAWLKEHPDDAEIMIEYVWLCYEDVSMEEWEQLLASDVLSASENSEVHGKLADAYYLMGDDAKAAHHFRVAVQLDETNWRAWQGLALLYTTAQVSFQEAERFLRKALEIAPSEWQIAFNLGSIYAQQEKRFEAQQMLRKALALAPSSKRDLIEHHLRSVGDVSDMPQR